MKILHLPEPGDFLINNFDKTYTKIIKADLNTTRTEQAGMWRYEYATTCLQWLPRLHAFVFDYKSSVATQPKEVP